MKKLICWLLALVMAFCAVGCSKSMGGDAAYDKPQMNAPSDTNKEWAGDSAGLELPSPDRKIIQRVDYSLETKDFDATLSSLKERIAKSGSYVQSSNISGQVENGNARAHFVIRVPVGAYADFRAAVEGLGNVVYVSEGGEDVTTAYFDTEARLKTLTVQETRLLELLSQAATIDDILRIEDSLAQVRYQIEQLTTTLKRYDDLVDFATVELELTQSREYTVSNPTFGEQILEAVQGSAEGALHVGKTLILVLIWLLPYLIVGGAVATLVILLLRRNRKKKTQTRDDGMPM